VDVVRVATPAVKAAVPRELDPSLKVTLPVAEEGVNVAVRVTVWPDIEAAGVTLRVVVVAVTAATDSAAILEVLAATLESPPYEAESKWLPETSVVVLRVAVPPVRGAVPRVDRPSRNVTVPVAEAGVTTAVRVTDCPGVDDAGVTESVVEELWSKPTIRQARVPGIRDAGMTPPGNNEPLACGSISSPAKALKSPVRSAAVGT
jgi:hypothetical protein